MISSGPAPDFNNLSIAAACPKRKQILLDSIIQFKNKNNSSETLTCYVKEIIIDDSFKKIIELCGVKNVMSGDFTGSVDDAVQIYEKIPHNELLDKGIKTYKQAIEHFGVVAFKISCAS